MSYSIQEEGVSISDMGKTVLFVKGLFFSIGMRKTIGLGASTDADSLHPSLSACEANMYQKYF